MSILKHHCLFIGASEGIEIWCTSAQKIWPFLKNFVKYLQTKGGGSIFVSHICMYMYKTLFVDNFQRYIIPCGRVLQATLTSCNPQELLTKAMARTTF